MLQYTPVENVKHERMINGVIWGTPLMNSELRTVQIIDRTLHSASLQMLASKEMQDCNATSMPNKLLYVYTNKSGTLIEFLRTALTLHQNSRTSVSGYLCIFTINSVLLIRKRIIYQYCTV
jgi:hypothetical protein